MKMKRGFFITLGVLLVFAAAFAAFAFSSYGRSFFGWDTNASEKTTQSALSADENDNDVLKVYYIDVWQGDCELVQIPTEDGYFNMLIDCGIASYRKDLISFLENDLGISRLDTIMVSHPHADHIGGMADIIKSFDVGKIYMSDIPDDLTPTTVAYEKMLDAIEAKGLKIKILYGGDNIELPKGASGEILGPVSGESFDELNDYSLVFKLKYSNRSFLFTGDSEIAENKTIIGSGADMNCDVLKVPHHGSSGATNKTLLKNTNPSYAVICVGKDNDYGHPTEKVLNLLSDANIQTYRTDLDGTVLFTCDKDKISVKTGLRSIKAE